jgi:WXG100 family type VII secretion target
MSSAIDTTSAIWGDNSLQHGDTLAAPPGAAGEVGTGSRGEYTLATQVTPEMLTDAGNTAASAGETITMNLQRLLMEIQTQAKAFQGAGGTAFQNVSHDLGQELKNMLEALNTMAANVHASNRNFGSTDEDAQNEITKVASEHSGNGSYNGIANTLRGA